MKLFSWDLLLSSFLDNHIIFVGFFLMCLLHYCGNTKIRFE